MKNKIQIIEADITTLDVDAVVNAAHIAPGTTIAFLTGDDRLGRVVFCCFGEHSRIAHEEAMSALE